MQLATTFKKLLTIPLSMFLSVFFHPLVHQSKYALKMFIHNTLLFTSTCNSVGYTILFENKHKYKLIASAIPGKSCGEIIDKQFADVHQAIRSTTEYEIKDAQLILIGEGVQVVLEIDNPQ